MKTMMIMAGGTGGHVIPALAVATELVRNDINVSWIGSKEGLESRLVAEAGIEFDAIDIKGLRKNGILRQLMMPFMLINAMFQTFGVLRKRKPDAVLGMGGFVSGPGGLMSALLRIPLILHEQNSVAGLTNRWLAKLSQSVFTGFPFSQGILNPLWIGNPVRKSIVDLPHPEDRLKDHQGALRILVVGGSQGASVFNEHLPELLGQMPDIDLSVWHQCGKQGDKKAIWQGYEQNNIEARVSQFIDDMAAAYAWCDLLICRSGAMTVSEVCAAGVAAIFVPYPFAVSDHQAENAKFLVSENAAHMVRQPAFIQGDWLNLVKELVVDRQCLLNLSAAARSFAKPDASTELARACMEVMNA